MSDANPRNPSDRGTDKLLRDINSPETQAAVDATRQRCKLSDAKRHLLLALALASDGSALLEEIEYCCVNAYYDGKSDGLTAAHESLNKLIHRDDGDATSGTLPLAKLGQGDYTREINP